MQNRYVKSFNDRMRDELLNERLFFGLDHTRCAIAEWADDYNNFRPPPCSDTRRRRTLPGSSPQPAQTLRNLEASRFRRLLPPRPLAYQKKPRL